jgi:hypothetical protein
MAISDDGINLLAGESETKRSYGVRPADFDLFFFLELPLKAKTA